MANRVEDIRKVISGKGGGQFRRLGIGATRLAKFIDYIGDDLVKVIKPKTKAKATPPKAKALASGSSSVSD